MEIILRLLIILTLIIIPPLMIKHSSALSGGL